MSDRTTAINQASWPVWPACNAVARAYRDAYSLGLTDLPRRVELAIEGLDRAEVLIRDVDMIRSASTEVLVVFRGYAAHVGCSSGPLTFHGRRRWSGRRERFVLLDPDIPWPPEDDSVLIGAFEKLCSELERLAEDVRRQAEEHARTDPVIGRIRELAALARLGGYEPNRSYGRPAADRLAAIGAGAQGLETATLELVAASEDIDPNWWTDTDSLEWPIADPARSEPAGFVAVFRDRRAMVEIHAAPCSLKAAVIDGEPKIYGSPDWRDLPELMRHPPRHDIEVIDLLLSAAEQVRRIAEQLRQGGQP